MPVLTFVSFEENDSAFPPDVEEETPGRALAEFVAGVLRGAGFDVADPEDPEGWAWELYSREGNVDVHCIVGLTDDRPMQWQIHSYGRAGRLRRLFARAELDQPRDDMLLRWCEAIDRALKSDERYRSVRWYDQKTFEQDHGRTWAESPTA